MGQQTRLWFYPDKVDLTLSPQGDAMLMRRVRMSASSERFLGALSATTARGEEPPWTRATIEAINRDYDTLAKYFPEMGDLDQVVRLLSLFAWLRQAENEGLQVPDLDVLLALELPAYPTPRTFPQLLAFNALPPAGSGAEVATIDRVAAAEALERLNPNSGRPLPAARRLDRAIAGLDRRNPMNRALIEEVAALDSKRLESDVLDVLAHRAERLRMHQTVLATLEADRVAELAERRRAGEKLRVFSVGIGGLDLGMGRVVARAGGRSMALGAAAPVLASALPRAAEPSAGRRPTAPMERREEWREDPPLLPVTVLPDHGLGAGEVGKRESREFGNNSISRNLSDQPDSGQTWVWTLLGADSPDVISRRVVIGPQGRLLSVDRTAGSRTLRYRFEKDGSAWKARLLPVQESAQQETSWIPDVGLPDGSALLRVVVDEPQEGGEPGILLRLHGSQRPEGRSLEADFPRAALQRLVMGPEADLEPGRPIAGLDPMPRELGRVESLLVALNRPQRARPWEQGAAVVAGEENPIRLARALNVWWSSEGRGGLQRSAVVVTSPAESVKRWEAAPRPGGSAILLLPEDAFPGRLTELRNRFRQGWDSGAVVESLPAEVDAKLVVLISGEAPGRFAARLRELADEPAMRGKLLAAWCLTSSVRQDLPASLLSAGGLAGVGLAEASVVGRRRAAEHLGALDHALSTGGDANPRVEGLSSLFLWYF
jgi:hypothetical protein